MQPFRYQYQQKLAAEVKDAIALLQYTMRLPATQKPQCLQDGLACFEVSGHILVKTDVFDLLQTLALRSKDIWDSRCCEVDWLRALVPTIVEFLNLSETTRKASEVFTNILEQFPEFLDPHLLRLLAEQLISPFAQVMIKAFQNEDYGDKELLFMKLLVAYGNGAVRDIVEGHEDPTMNAISWQLCKLMQCSGHPEIGDVACQALEFWKHYVEYLSDFKSSHEGKAKPRWFKFATNRVIAIVEACFVKSCWPDAGDLGWDPQELESFHNFRQAAKEFFRTAYVYLGIDLFNRFTVYAVKSKGNQARNRLEGSIFALNGLAETLPKELLNIEGPLTMLFSSGIIFENVDKAEEFLTLELQKSILAAITSYTSHTCFFQKHPTFLAPMLNFLFNTVQDLRLADVASVAVKSVCSACRTQLVPELGAFLKYCTVLLANASIQSIIKERVFEGITMVIQAIPSEDAKCDVLGALLRLPESDYSRAISLLEAGQIAAAQQFALRALRILASMGKALRASNEVVPQTNGSMHWTSGKGANLQIRILQMIVYAASSIHPTKDTVEAICEILRAGYSESMPGPFTFRPTVTVDMVLSSSLSTPKLEYLIETAGVMLARRPDASGQEMQDAAYSILGHCKNLMCSVPGIYALYSCTEA